MYDAVDGTSIALYTRYAPLLARSNTQAPLPTSSSMTTHCTNQTQEETWIDGRFLKQPVLYFLHVV
jgi:hypothetical protein